MGTVLHCLYYYTVFCKIDQRPLIADSPAKSNVRQALTGVAQDTVTVQGFATNISETVKADTIQ